ncbi:MAG TPA: MlrC C-terminal domain-containing protein [Acetobacteraceae bacterium]|nr:MlrC C-terminal domain-containing protein [Acetobacteraceae bacterium]
MLERNVHSARLGPMWDPIAVRLCLDAGLGAAFPLRFGGKIGPTSGQPVDAMVTVNGLRRDAWQSFGPTQVPLGDCAAIKIGGVGCRADHQPCAGAWPRIVSQHRDRTDGRKLVVVRSTNHFMAAFGSLARKVLYVDSDGPLTRDYRKIVYTKVRRPIWPLDEATYPGLVS